MPAKPGDRPKRRAAVDADFFGVFQQPLIEQNSMMATMLMDIEFQILQEEIFHELNGSTRTSRINP